MRRLLPDALFTPGTDARTATIRGATGRSVHVTCYEGSGLTNAVVIYLHGGAWIMGSREDHPERLWAIAKAGPTVVSIDYALASQAPYPAQREDIEAVLASIVPAGAPTFLMGASAGAHLAALSAFTMQSPPQGLICLFGRYDLTSDAAHIQPVAGTVVPDEIRDNPPPAGVANLTSDERLALLAGVDMAELTQSRRAMISPVQMLTAQSPPILAVHGTADGVVAHGHSERLVARARFLGVRARLVLVEGANHEDEAFAGPAVVGEIVRFVDEESKKR